MTIFKSRDNWRAVVYVNGKRVTSRAGFTRRSKAKDWHDEQLMLFRSGEMPTGDATFDELLAKFIAWHLPSIGASSRKRYMTEIDRRIRREFTFLKLSQITSASLENWKSRLGATANPRGANYCLEVMRTILNRGVKWKLLRESPYSLESFPVPKRQYEWWEDRGDIKRFLDVARERSKFYPIYLLALETGMRYGEIVGLAKESVDLQAGRIAIVRQWLHQQREFGPPKHGEHRWVDFAPEGEIGRVLAKAMKRSKFELVFPGLTGRPYSRSGLASKVFKSLQKRARVPELRFHDLRHTFASWYMLEHDNVWDLKAILGHSDIKTTMRYAHHSKKTRRKPLNMAAAVAHRSPTGAHLKLAK